MSSALLPGTASSSLMAQSASTWAVVCTQPTPTASWAVTQRQGSLATLQKQMGWLSSVCSAVGFVASQAGGILSSISRSRGPGKHPGVDWGHKLAVLPVPGKSGLGRLTAGRGDHSVASTSSHSLPRGLPTDGPEHQAAKVSKAWSWGAQVPTGPT